MRTAGDAGFTLGGLVAVLALLALLAAALGARKRIGRISL